MLWDLCSMDHGCISGGNTGFHRRRDERRHRCPFCSLPDILVLAASVSAPCKGLPPPYHCQETSRVCSPNNEQRFVVLGSAGPDNLRASIPARRTPQSKESSGRPRPRRSSTATCGALRYSELSYGMTASLSAISCDGSGFRDMVRGVRHVAQLTALCRGPRWGAARRRRKFLWDVLERSE